ncbi:MULTISPECIES: PAS domain S-box protein [unclassified Microcoleus]|uniref:PAS domain S-box protein n=1 Tax=unclassified Microcoleus TaxID=2642155 RepID=UPI002FD31038
MSKFPPDKNQAKQQEDTTAQALRQTHFDAFFAGANVGMMILDHQLRYVQINEVMAQINCVCVADHMGRSVREVLPELAPTLEPILQGILDTGQPMLDLELVGETPKEPGILRYWQASYYPLLDENGKVFGLGGIVIEVSDAYGELRLRKRAEQKQARLTAILEATSDLVGVTDATGHSVYLNQAGQEMLGMSPEEARSPFSIDSVLAPSAKAKFHNEIIPTALREGRWAGEILFLSRDGEEIPVSQVLIVHKTAAGEVEFISTVARDIREQQAALRDRKKAEEERQLLATTIENSRDFIGVASMDGRPMLVNQAGMDLMGLSSVDEAKTKHITDFFMPEDLDFVQQYILPVLMKEGNWRSDFRLRHFVTGQPIAVDYTLFLVNHPETNEPIGIATITRDIRDRKQAEEALRHKEAQYRSIFESVNDGIIITELETGNLVAINPAQARIHGYTSEEFAQLPPGGFIHPDSYHLFVDFLETVKAGKQFFCHAIDVRKDNKCIDVEVTASPYWQDDKLYALSVVRDISDRKQAEDAIKQSEERYRSLIVATSQMVWITDAEGRCQDTPTFRAYTGQTEAEVVGFGWLDAIHPDDRERTVQVWMEAVQTKSLFEIEYQLRRADGNYRYFQARAVPILNEDGSIREWVGTCSDIHDRKQAEFVLSKAKEAAEAASRAKSEFLANMSHELRTPLNGIMGYAQILQRSKVLKEEERSRIDVIYQCGSHLLTLINDILDLSKIEAQKVELMPTDFHFPAFLQGVAEMCRIRAELKGIQFNFPSSPELPIGIRADEKRLRQVLINLLSNAIKFTDAGTVTFIVSFATEAKIRFEIRDTGIGIAQDQLQAIFQPFEQVGDRRRQTEGTGLGLAISKRIVELMGSTIEVQSEMNVGSIFWFDVNLSQAEEWVKTSQIDHHGQIIGIKDRQPKIVVIDDKWANRSVISNLLSPIGFEVSEANDGQEGWEKIIELQPDLIVTDLLMPELDGYELIKRVRESANFKDIVIIVSSASVFETDQYRSLEAGGNTFIPKPVQATELLQKLQQYLGLEWVYEANEEPLARSSDTNELIAPPATKMEILYELAMQGNFLEIVKQAALLEEIDPKYIPFAKILYQMAKDFQDEEILTFIESYK